MAFKFLSKDVILGFDKYKYNCLDTSPLSNHVMHPFWNWLVKFYPLWLAPNVLTFTGFFLIIFSFLLLGYYDEDFFASDELSPEHKPIPSWVFLISSICFFFAHQLDGTDGKQARRTGSSTPLGELVDHGLDSFTSVLMPLCFYSNFGRGDSNLGPLRLYWVILAISVLFFFTHWEKYITGTLYLPWSYDISLWGMTIIFFLSSFLGTSVWKTSLPFFHFSIAHLFELFVHGSFFIFGLPVTFLNIYNSYKLKTGNLLSFYESIRPLTPLFLHIIFMTTWAYKSEYQILEKHPRLFLLTFGTIFSNITCRCIVNGMSQTRCQAYNFLLSPLIFILITLFLIQTNSYEYTFLICLFLFSLISHILYAYNVITELALHFNIYVFSVNKISSQDDKKL